MTENNLDTDQIRGLVWRLAIPSMLAQFVSVFYSIVDRMYIGNIAGIGEIALAGVGICGPIVTMVSSVAFLVCVGGSPLMSIRMGEKNHRAASQILANCFLLLTVLSAAITVFSLMAKNKLLMWFGASEATFSYANDYITICLLGTVFALLATGMNQFIICQGFAKVAMKSVILGAVCNIVLDPVFMFVFGLEVKGAAIATVLSQMASCAYVLRFLFGDKPPIRITFGHYDWQIMRRVLLLGLTPFLIIAFDNVLIIALNMVIQRYGGESQGDTLLTCMTIVQSFMLMVTMPLGGITGGTQTVLGYNFGAGRPDRIKKAAGHIAGLALVFTTVMFILAHTVPHYFVRIFTRNEAYVELTVWAIKIYTMGIIPLALQYTVVDGFVGMGAAKAAISLSMFRKAIFLVGAALIPIWFGVEKIFYIEPVSDFVSVVVSLTVTFLIFDRVVAKRTAD
ncbi:MAG: MATE family efflux transporter [Lacrimispora sp.]|uniref:MATE family efflux transporter n=1 Tax=Lacrimispora sp. TaxID=2719234 RepID=UPI0039E6F1B3